MYAYGEVDSLVRAVTQAQSGQHIALGSDTQTCTATAQSHILNLLPQLVLDVADICLLGIACNLIDNLLNLLQLEVDDVVHHTHSLTHVLLEEVEVELSLCCEGVLHVAEQVQCQQTAAVVGTQGNLTAGVSRYGVETEVGVAVGHTLTNDSIPEQNTGLG